MPTRKSIDYVLFTVTILLVAIGIMLVFSSSFYYAMLTLNDKTHFLFKNLKWAALGLGVMIFTANFRYTAYKKLAPVFMIISLGTLLVLLTPMGHTINDATRWIKINNQTFMPSELAKFSMIIFLASSLSVNNEKLKNFSNGLLPYIMVIVLFAWLILKQPDLSTAFILGASSIFVLFIAGMKWIHLFIAGSAGTLAVYLAVITSDYRMARVLAFTDPFANMYGIGWQVSHGLFALGLGGLTGVGLGQGTLNKLYIPEPQNDFIIATLGEEFGFVGIVVLLLLFLILIWRGFRIALKAPDLFSSLLASGITGLIAIQVFINVAVTTSSIPPTGVPLPFISFGGTALVLTMAAVGIVLNISRYSVET